MSEAQTAPKPRAIPAAAPASGKPGQAAPGLMSELRVSAHLMSLDAGLFCVVQTPSRAADLRSGLPGVRLSVPPGASGRPEAVSISGFRGDGWLSGTGDASLVRVTQGPAQLLVTIYQAPNAPEGSAPSLQVMRLLDAAGQSPAPAMPQPAPVAHVPAPNAPAPNVASPNAPADKVAAGAPTNAPAQPAPGPVATVMEMVAHIQERGDIGAMFGEWLGDPGSKRWIEGFGLAPIRGVAAKDIEYQAVLGRGWLSPWVEGGQFCGSRAMALPVLGFRVRLRGEAAATHSVSYAATFVDGSRVGPVSDGEACESEALVGMEAFSVAVVPKVAAATSPPTDEPDSKVKKKKSAETPAAVEKPKSAPRKR